MCVTAREGDHPTPLRERIPLAQYVIRTIKQLAERFDRSQRIREQRSQERQACFIPPFAVSVEPFQSAEPGRPIAPA